MREAKNLARRSGLRSCFRPHEILKRRHPLSGFSAKLSEKSGEKLFVVEHGPRTIC